MVERITAIGCFVKPEVKLMQGATTCAGDSCTGDSMVVIVIRRKKTCDSDHVVEVPKLLNRGIPRCYLTGIQSHGVPMHFVHIAVVRSSDHMLQMVIIGVVASDSKDAGTKDRNFIWSI